MPFEKITTLAFSMYSNKGAYALLCGAGISRSAGIKTGWHIEEDLIKRIAATQSITSASNWHDWYKSAYGKDASYSGLLEEVVNTPTERVNLMKAYFEPTKEEREDEVKTPTKAHKAIAKLVKAGYIKVIISPNFDRLFETALSEEGVPFQTVYHNDDLKKITPIVHGGVTIVKMNGDYLDCRFRNTSEELDSYEQEMETFLSRLFEDFGLITCGWSAAWDKGLIRLLSEAKQSRYSSYFTYVNECNKELADISGIKNGELLKVADADTFFHDLSEQVFALERYNVSSSLSKDVFLSRLKKYIPLKDKQIDLEELLEQECNRACRIIQENADYSANFITQNLFNHFKKIHLQSIDTLIDATKILIRWGKDSQLEYLYDIYRKLCLNTNTKYRNHSGTKWLHIIAPSILMNVFGVACLKYKRYKPLIKLFQLRVHYGNFLEMDTSFNLAYLNFSNHWDNDEWKRFTGSTSCYPHSGFYKMTLERFFTDSFETYEEFEDVFYTWEHLQSLLYDYYKCDPFRSESSFFLLGSFYMYNLRRDRCLRGFHYDFFEEAKLLRDQWEPIKQGLFNGKFSEFEACYNEAEDYYPKNLNH